MKIYDADSEEIIEEEEDSHDEPPVQVAVVSTDTIDQYHKNELLQKGYEEAKKSGAVGQAYTDLANKDLLSKADEGKKDIDNNSEIGDINRDTAVTDTKSENDASYCNRYRATLSKYHKNPDGLAKPQAMFWVIIDWTINIIALIVGGWVLILLKKLFDLTAKLGKSIWIFIGVLLAGILIYAIIKITIQLNGITTPATESLRFFNSFLL